MCRNASMAGLQLPDIEEEDIEPEAVMQRIASMTLLDGVQNNPAPSSASKSTSLWARLSQSLVQCDFGRSSSNLSPPSAAALAVAYPAPVSESECAVEFVVECKA